MNQNQFIRDVFNVIKKHFPSPPTQHEANQIAETLVGISTSLMIRSRGASSPGAAGVITQETLQFLLCFVAMSLGQETRVPPLGPATVLLKVLGLMTEREIAQTLIAAAMVHLERTGVPIHISKIKSVTDNIIKTVEEWAKCQNATS